MTALTVPGTLDSLVQIRAYVRAAARAAGLDPKQAYRLELAVDEIATNIVAHGYGEDARAGDLDLSVEITDETLAISVEDTARPFDPLAYAAPTNLDTPLEQRRIGGLGIYLAIKNVDRFLYARVGDRNRTTFVVNRGRPVPVAPGI